MSEAPKNTQTNPAAKQSDVTKEAPATDTASKENSVNKTDTSTQSGENAGTQENAPAEPQKPVIDLEKDGSNKAPLVNELDTASAGAANLQTERVIEEVKKYPAATAQPRTVEGDPGRTVVQLPNEYWVTFNGPFSGRVLVTAGSTLADALKMASSRTGLNAGDYSFRSGRFVGSNTTITGDMIVESTKK